MLRCQRRPKALLFRPGILLPDELQHLPPEFLWLRAVRTFSRTAALKPLGSLSSISLPESLGLPVAQLQHLRCVYQPQRLALHSPQNLCSSKFPRTHRHARSATSCIMLRFEQIVVSEKPNLIIVYGDVNSTLAAALVCSKLHLPLAHVEAGLRSFDRTMPEEINLLLT